MTDQMLVPVRRALLSVSDKDGLLPLAGHLAQRGVELLSTGGTAKLLREAGLSIVDVAEHTGFPEILSGRVKTLHPRVHGGLLGRRNEPEDQSQMADHGIAPIDLLVANLYPFEATLAAGRDLATCIENIDIGGPAMIRAAAKNHDHVAVVVDPADYDALLAELAEHDGCLTQALRGRLAATAFARTAAYDAVIADYLHGQLATSSTEHPQRMTITGVLRQRLRYGENPHQAAALYQSLPARPGLASATQAQGKPLSYNNLSDADAAQALVKEFERPAIAIIKHANPCGVAVADDLVAAYRAAHACDPESAFGGIVAANRTLDVAIAEAITGIFTEVIVAPGADDAAREIIAGKPNLRLLLLDAAHAPEPQCLVRTISGGFLVQHEDAALVGADALRTVTRRAPTEAELHDLLFADTVCKHLKSNAIVFARGGATVGLGAGQMSRLDAARIAGWKATHTGQGTAGSVAASDAFFPFPDALQALVEAGATAVIQPGGSMRDDAVIAAADDVGIAMVFSSMRHFRH